MALVQRTHIIRLRFVDNDGAQSTCEINLAVGTAYATALAFAAAWRPLVEQLSDAVCIASDLLIRWTETNAPASGSASDVQRNGVFIFGAALEMAALHVPSLDLRVLESTGPYAGIRIDQTRPSVQAFAAALANGLNGVQPCDPFAVDLGPLTRAYREQV